MKRAAYLCEVEVTPGLEFVSEAELRSLAAQVVRSEAGEIDFRYSGDLRDLLRLKTAQAVSLVQPFPVPRPKALLSNEFVPLILQQIETIRDLASRDTYRTFFIAAAGSESAVMQRIKAVIAEKTGLKAVDDKGDLWLRIRPGRVGRLSKAEVGGWEIVARLTPRPSVTRSWRVCNLEGALNAATAAAMIRLTEPKPDDTFANLGCGSATLLIERLAYGACRNAFGFDIDPASIACARANVRASGSGADIHLSLADIRRLPLPASSVDALCADLPFGQLSGSHAENERLYPRVLAEAARVARVGARFVLITHEVNLTEDLLRRQEAWALENSIRVNLRGLHPRIYVLKRH